MKTLIFYTEDNNGEIIIKDNDDDNLSEYTKKIANILSSGKITILETDGMNFIMRPSKINHIKIIESKNKIKKEVKKEIKIENKKEIIDDKIILNENEDYITDGD